MTFLTSKRKKILSERKRNLPRILLMKGEENGGILPHDQIKIEMRDRTVEDDTDHLLVLHHITEISSEREHTMVIPGVIDHL